MYKLFGNTAKTETQVQIFNAINRFNFGWKIDNREVEEESYANLCKLVTDHYGSQYKFTFCRMLCNLKRFPGDRSKSHENGKKGKGRVVFFYARPKKQKTKSVFIFFRFETSSIRNIAPNRLSPSLGCEENVSDRTSLKQLKKRCVEK